MLNGIRVGYCDLFYYDSCGCFVCSPTLGGTFIFQSAPIGWLILDALGRKEASTQVLAFSVAGSTLIVLLCLF